MMNLPLQGKVSLPFVVMLLRAVFCFSYFEAQWFVKASLDYQLEPMNKENMKRASKPDS
jgi:hypothetical protein